MGLEGMFVLLSLVTKAVFGLKAVFLTEIIQLRTYWQDIFEVAGG